MKMMMMRRRKEGGGASVIMQGAGCVVVWARLHTGRV